MEDLIRAWVITDHPSDMAEVFVARLHLIGEDRHGPTDEFYAHRSKEMLIEQLLAENPGLVCIPRDPKDDPVIVEMWV